MRYGLLARDLAVARAALFGRNGRLGLVGIVALDTGCAWVVSHGVDLWEARRTCGVVRMAYGAETPFAGRRRLDAARGVHVVHGWTVAYLT
jgi:hypothetical protein